MNPWIDDAKVNNFKSINFIMPVLSNNLVGAKSMESVLSNNLVSTKLMESVDI